MNASTKAGIALAAVFVLALAAVSFSQKPSLRAVALLEYSLAAPIGGIELNPQVIEFDTRVETFLTNFEMLIRSEAVSQATLEELGDIRASTANTGSSNTVAPQTLSTENIWLIPNETIDQATRSLSDSIGFKSIPNTNLIQVSLTSTRTEQLAEVLNALINKALEKRKDNNQAFFNREIQRIYDERDSMESQRFLAHQQFTAEKKAAIQRQITELEAVLPRLKSRKTTNSSLPNNSVSTTNDDLSFLTYSHDAALRKLNQEQSRYLGQLESLSLESPLRTSLLLEIERIRNEQTQIQSLREKLLMNQAQSTRPQSAAVKQINQAVSREIQSIQTQLAQLRSELRSIDTVPTTAADSHLQAIETLETELENVVRTASSVIRVHWFKRPAIEHSRR